MTHRTLWLALETSQWRPPLYNGQKAVPQWPFYGVSTVFVKLRMHKPHPLRLKWVGVVCTCAVGVLLKKQSSKMWWGRWTRNRSTSQVCIQDFRSGGQSPLVLRAAYACTCQTRGVRGHPSPRDIWGLRSLHFTTWPQLVATALLYYTIYLPPCITIPSLLQMTPPEHQKLSRATRDEDSPDCSLMTSGSNRLKLLLCLRYALLCDFYSITLILSSIVWY